MYASLSVRFRWDAQTFTSSLYFLHGKLNKSIISLGFISVIITFSASLLNCLTPFSHMPLSIMLFQVKKKLFSLRSNSANSSVKSPPAVFRFHMHTEAQVTLLRYTRQCMSCSPLLPPTHTYSHTLTHTHIFFIYTCIYAYSCPCGNTFSFLAFFHSCKCCRVFCLTGLQMPHCNFAFRHVVGCRRFLHRFLDFSL